jgi:hypothetical protein
MVDGELRRSANGWVVEQEGLVSDFMVWKLFHINEEIERCSTNIEQANSKLKGLKSAQVREQAIK